MAPNIAKGIGLGNLFYVALLGVKCAAYLWASVPSRRD
jgi:hypothetical protein